MKFEEKRKKTRSSRENKIRGKRKKTQELHE